MRSAEGLIKLGHSIAPLRRQKELKAELVHITDVIEDAEVVERLAHRVLALSARHMRGEWFSATLEQAIAAIEVSHKQAGGEELRLGGRLVQYRNGAPVESGGDMLHVRMPKATMRMLDDLRKLEDDLPSRADMVRRILRRALAAKRKTAIELRSNVAAE